MNTTQPPTIPATIVRSPRARLTEESADAFADAVFRRVCAGTASFAELLAAVTLAEAMRDRTAPIGGAS